MSNNNHEAILSLFHEHYEGLQQFLTARLHCEQAAADIVQETYLRVLSLDNLQAIRQPRAFLYKTALNLITDSHRKQQTRAECTDSADSLEFIPSHQPLPETVVQSQQALAHLRLAIRELPPKCRTVFLLYKFNGLSHIEIARRFSISNNMVEKHIIHAMLHCRRRMAEWIDD